MTSTIDAEALKSKLLRYVIFPAALFAAHSSAEMPAVVTPPVPGADPAPAVVAAAPLAVEAVVVATPAVVDDESESLPHAATVRARATRETPAANRLVTLVIWAPCWLAWVRG